MKCINANTNNQREKELQDNCNSGIEDCNSDIVEVKNLKIEETEKIAKITKDEDDVQDDLIES